MKDCINYEFIINGFIIFNERRLILKKVENYFLDVKNV